MQAQRTVCPPADEGGSRIGGICRFRLARAGRLRGVGGKGKPYKGLREHRERDGPQEQAPGIVAQNDGPVPPRMPSAKRPDEGIYGTLGRFGRRPRTTFIVSAA